MLIVWVAIGAALFFAFWNGFTDAANAISTIVATKVLTPAQAVALSAFGNFIGMFLGIAVATTIGKGIIESNIITAELVLAALIGGLLWDVFTWWLALPVSESHVLVGSLVGAGTAAAGWEVVKVGGIVDKVLVPMVVSPTVALVVAFAFTAAVVAVARNHPQASTNRYFRKLQILSSLLFSITHGSNDAQKAMGIITVLMVSYGMLATFEVPLWVIIACHAAISIGTFFGGWRIVETMATKITKLRPYHGFCAETSGALVLSATALLGFPVSTTHVIAGSIMGVGATRRAKAVRWGMSRKIVIAWLLTMPMSAISSFFVYHVIAAVL